MHAVRISTPDLPKYLDMQTQYIRKEGTRPSVGKTAVDALTS